MTELKGNKLKLRLSNYDKWSNFGRRKTKRKLLTEGGIKIIE